MGSKEIMTFVRSSKCGDPVPNVELIGHTTTVYCLHADEFNKRLFSGSGDNSVAVWYYDKLQDTMLQIQQLKSVSKSSKFLCITTAKNINCLIAGGDNGFITIWHEYDVECDELSDRMYENQRRVAAEEQKVQRVEVVDTSDNVPPSLTQQSEILKQQEKRFDISKNNLKNGSIRSKKSQANMVWKCLYAWKAHKGSVTTVTYFEEFNMLMSTSQSGQIRLVYLCDPGKVPPIQMVRDRMGHSPHFPEFIKDKLNKTFNEIQEIESNNYANTEYQELNLVDEYEKVDEDLDCGDDYQLEENKIEEEPEDLRICQNGNGHLENEQMDNVNVATDDFDDHDDLNGQVDEDQEEKEIIVETEESDKLIENVLHATHEHTSLENLL